MPREKHHIHIPKIFWVIVLFIGLFIVGAAWYPPIMILALDLFVISGVIIVLTGISHLWKHQIERIGQLMNDAQEAMSMDPAQREEYEQYQILTSAYRSMQVLKKKPDCSTEEKKQLSYLKRRYTQNQFVLFGRMIAWNVKAFFTRSKSHPSLGENISVILREPRFFPTRIFAVLWLITTIVGVRMILM